MVKMTEESELRQVFIELLEGGIEEEQKQRYKLAVTAYFKAITQLCDLHIIKTKAISPRSHTERFRTLERYFPEMYSVVDSVFGVYQDTYSVHIDAESCRLIKDEIKKIAKIAGLEEEFKESLGKIQDKDS